MALGGLRPVTTPVLPWHTRRKPKNRLYSCRFRLGTEQLLTEADGKSWISYEDFAVALADEIERPAHIRRRFTVGY